MRPPIQKPGIYRTIQLPKRHIVRRNATTEALGLCFAMEDMKSSFRKIALVFIFLIAALRASLEMLALEPQLIEAYLPETITQMGAEGTCRHLAIPIERLQTPTEPQAIIVPAIFLHVGKAGGGSIEYRAAMNWNVALCRCHPDPCPRLVDGSSHYWINIRDPIDRFVSIFNWRMIVLCHPEGDPRTPVSQGAFADTEHLCEMEMPFNRDEIQALFFTYQADVNILAESLCPATEASLDAEPDLALIRHTPTLQDWLGGDWKSIQSQIYPLIQEQGADFNKQIDDAIFWLHNETQFESEEKFQQRANEALRFETEIRMTEDSTSSHRHSSGEHPPLSRNAERCLAKLFEEDYRLMSELLEGGVCKNNECSAGLSSILDRRSALLTDTESTEAASKASVFHMLSSLLEMFT